MRILVSTCIFAFVKSAEKAPTDAKDVGTVCSKNSDCKDYRKCCGIMYGGKMCDGRKCTAQTLKEVDAPNLVMCNYDGKHKTSRDYVRMSVQSLEPLWATEGLEFMSC